MGVGAGPKSGTHPRMMGENNVNLNRNGGDEK